MSSREIPINYNNENQEIKVEIDNIVYRDVTIKTISVNGVNQEIDENKNVDIIVPTKISQLQNDNDTVQDSSYVHTDNNYTNSEKSKLAGLNNYDDTQVQNDISNLKTNTGATIELSINSSTYVMTLNLKNSVGTVLSSGTVDLPLESVVVNGSYDSTNKKVILTLQNGNTIEFSVADLVSGLQSEITSQNKLSADLVDDSNSNNKFVSDSDKNNWNGKLDSNKVKNESSTTAGDTYDVRYINSALGDIESILTRLTTGGGVS